MSSDDGPSDQQQQEAHATCPLLLSPEDFAHDAEHRLGRANGNTFQRRPAVENTHDGQIMVRLKKKRFIIIDYGIVPTEQDKEYVSGIPYVVVPEGAGERLCATRNCPRIGVPVQLYDTEPTEPASLYLRGGLCFSCQRNLNEKRRTQRKRKSDAVETSSTHAPAPAVAAHQQPQQPRYRLNGNLLDLNPDAVIINGPIDGTRTRGPDYQYPRIGQDLLHLASEINNKAHALISTAFRTQSMGTVGTPSSIAQINGLFQDTFRDMSRATYLITQWKASWDENLGGNMMAVAAVGQQQAAAVAAQQAGMQMHAHVNGGEGVGGGRQGGQVQVQQQQIQQQQQQQQQQQVSALMAPDAASSAASTSAGQQQQQPPQAQDASEEKANYDLSEFYEEV